jgi:hypothetical protein
MRECVKVEREREKEIESDRRRDDIKKRYGGW